MSSKRSLCFTAVALGFVLAAPQNASATILYATEASGPFGAVTPFDIVKLDTSANTDTTVLHQNTNIDSLIFDPSGRILYTEQNARVVGAYDLNTNTNTILNSSLPFPADLALDPSLTSFLVSNVGDFSANNVSRLSLTGTLLGSLSLNGAPNGIIYDNTGRLFVNVALSNGDHVVERIDPTTGAVLASSPDISGLFLDGLTFDAGTGMLFGSARQNAAPNFSGSASRILELDPSNLASPTLLDPTGTALNGPDGIVSDGSGHVYIADGANVLQYDIASNTDTVVATSTLGFDDIAPASGLGAPSTAVPEPSSLAILAASLVGAGLARRRRIGRKRDMKL